MSEFGAASLMCGGPFTDGCSDLRGGRVLCGQPQRLSDTNHFLARKNGGSSVQVCRWARQRQRMCALEKMSDCKNGRVSKQFATFLEKPHSYHYIVWKVARRQQGVGDE